MEFIKEVWPAFAMLGFAALCFRAYFWLRKQENTFDIDEEQS